MSKYIFVTNIFEYLNIRIYSSHSGVVLWYEIFLTVTYIMVQCIVTVVFNVQTLVGGILFTVFYFVVQSAVQCLVQCTMQRTAHCIKQCSGAR